MARAKKNQCQETPQTEEFLTRVNRLANYITRSGKSEKATLLFALFKVESTRRLAEQSLNGNLEGKGFRIVRLDVREYPNTDLVQLLLDKQTSPSDVFYVHRLRAGEQATLNALNYRRELLIENAVKVLFWLEESELQWLAFGAPDFWAFRHRVVEFIELPEEKSMQETVQRFYGDTEFVSHEELLVKTRLRQELLQALPKGATDTKARLHWEIGNLLHKNGELVSAKKHLEQALKYVTRLKDEPNRAATLHSLGIIAQAQGDYEEARRLYQQSLKINERLGNQSGMANSYHQLGMIAQAQGDYEEARRLYQQSLKIKERLGNQSGMANSFGQLGNIAYSQGDYEEARRLYQQSLKIDERLGNQAGMASSYHQLGMIAQDQGDYEEALTLINQAKKVFERLGNLPSIAQAQQQIDRIEQALTAQNSKPKSKKSPAKQNKNPTKK